MTKEEMCIVMNTNGAVEIFRLAVYKLVSVGGVSGGLGGVEGPWPWASRFSCPKRASHFYPSYLVFVIIRGHMAYKAEANYWYRVGLDTLQSLMNQPTVMHSIVHHITPFSHMTNKSGAMRKGIITLILLGSLDVEDPRRRGKTRK